MKKSILAMTASICIVGTILISCNTTAEKVENAHNNVIEANVDLDKANKEYLADMEKYREETKNKISANDKSIAEFKERIELEKNDAKDDYNKKIAGLEQKNSDIKKKMDEYSAEGKEKWELFKMEFSRDMDELVKAFKDLTVKNVK